MLALRRVSGCAPWPRGTFCLMGQNFIRFSGHVTPLEHSTWFPGGTSCLLGRTVGLSKAISCFLGAEPGRVVLAEDLQGTICHTSVSQGGKCGVFMCVCHQGKAIWHESEARWLSLRTLFATLPGVKVTNVTCLCGSDTRGELFGTRVRQGGFRSGRYLLHFREPRWQT